MLQKTLMECISSNLGKKKKDKKNILAKNTVGPCICKDHDKCKQIQRLLQIIFGQKHIFESPICTHHGFTGHKRVPVSKGLVLRKVWYCRVALWNYLRAGWQCNFPFWYSISCCLFLLHL